MAPAGLEVVVGAAVTAGMGTTPLVTVTLLQAPVNETKRGRGGER